MRASQTGDGGVSCLIDPLPTDSREARARDNYGVDSREARARFSDNYVVIGIVAVCVLMAVALLGAGILDTGEKRTTQPSTQAPVTTQSDTQAPAITQPSSQEPATGENKTP